MGKIKDVRPGDVVYLVFDDGICKKTTINSVGKINSVVVPEYLQLTYSQSEMTTNVYHEAFNNPFVWDSHNGMWVTISEKVARQFLEDMYNSKIATLKEEKETFENNYQLKMEAYESRLDEIVNGKIVNMVLE